MKAEGEGEREGTGGFPASAMPTGEKLRERKCLGRSLGDWFFFPHLTLASPDSRTIAIPVQ